ncbi:VF530 family protein [Thalassolituus sp.]|uniref:VF530 family protein n=1 Tax=Thalassolituus sp. TaxID=2030822 RepID=UPI0039827312
MSDSPRELSATRKQDPLHGVTLETLLEHLSDTLGWDVLASLVRINCFHSDPSVKSSLKFLRKTPWARTLVEQIYIGAQTGEDVEQIRHRLRLLANGGEPVRTVKAATTNNGPVPKERSKKAPKEGKAKAARTPSAKPANESEQTAEQGSMAANITRQPVPTPESATQSTPVQQPSTIDPWAKHR